MRIIEDVPSSGLPATENAQTFAALGGHGVYSYGLVDWHIGDWQYSNMAMSLEERLKALASDKRLQILAWLKDPTAHFRPQIDGDLVKDGVCGQLITEKLGVSQPTASEHLRVLSDAGFLTGKKIKQWVFYKRDEREIAAFKSIMRTEI